MEKNCCATQYPILLIHGTGFRDWKRISYWGRIPKALQDHGATVFFGQQDSWATVEDNGLFLKHRIQEILSETHTSKVNIIAHSKGGLDARYLASSLEMAPYIASITLISVPNHGSKTMDFLFRMPKFLFRLAGFFVNGWYRCMGDKKPDFYSVCHQFTTQWASNFNAQNPDVEGVLYRSYAGCMHSFSSDAFMWWQNLIIGWIEGENDGLVTPQSAKWTNFQEVWQGVGNRGVSHMDEVDFRRRPLRYHGQTFDIVDEYIQMVAALKQQNL